MDNEVLKMVRETKELLDKNNIVFWLDEGTLLGAIRNGGIIPGDGDIDFSMFYENIDDVLEICASLINKGYNIRYQKNLPYIEDLIQIYLPEDLRMAGIHVDFNIYTVVNEEAIRRGLYYPYSKKGQYLIIISRLLFRKTINRGGLFLKYFWKKSYAIRIFLSLVTIKFYTNFCRSIWQVVPKYMFKSFVDIEFLDMNFKVPERYEEYLRYRYGDDWRLPNSNWVWKESGDKAIKYRKLNSVIIKQKKLKPSNYHNLNMISNN